MGDGSTKETWRDLCGAHHSDEVMSDADVAWALSFSVSNAIGWARNIECGGEVSHGERCKSCGRGGSDHLRRYSASGLAHAWQMVAKHVETAHRTALASASRRLAAS